MLSMRDFIAILTQRIDIEYELPERRLVDTAWSRNQLQQGSPVGVLLRSLYRKSTTPIVNCVGRIGVPSRVTNWRPHGS